MVKVVFKLEPLDDKIKKKAMKTVSDFSGVESIVMDIKDKKMTVIGNFDPVIVVKKLKKLCHIEIVSVGPAEKKMEEPKKEEPKKADDNKKKDEPKEDPVAELIKAYKAHNPYLRSTGLHEKGLGLIASESVGMTSTSGSKDESTSTISGHFEPQSERVQGDDTTSLALEAVVMASTSGSKDEPTSAVSGHFEVHGARVKASYRSLSSGYQVPASSSEIVEEDVVPFPPQISTPPAHESEIQIVFLEARERMPSIHKLESEIVPCQTEGEGKMKRGLNASAWQLLKLAAKAAIELGKGNLVAVEPMRSSHVAIKNEIPVEDQLLRESVLYAKKSIKTTVQKIFSHINNVRTTKIAVIGTGGIGKTTVLKALINFPNTRHMFDVVILVTVSRYWSTRKVQNEVLRQLSFCREYSETDSQVAEKLLKVLKGKKFLLLLDDVWEQIDLEAVGIPVPSSENGCKIVIASRKIDARHDMNLFKVVEVKSISRKEARELFARFRYFILKYYI